MHELDFLIDERFELLTRREYDWVANFSGGISLTVGCLWRFLEAGCIRTTSSDDGHQFGLPAPVDAAARVNTHIGGVKVISVDLREGTLDLTVGFATGQLLQIVPDSSGYEAWQLFRHGVQFIAVGGGELAIFGASPRGG